MKREAELKAAFVRELIWQAPRAVVQQFLTDGSPDRSVTLCGKTTHWEFKHGTPSFEAPGLQLLTCERLAVQGHCRYVIWQETARGGGARTIIAHPRTVRRAIEAGSWLVDPEWFTVGYDMRLLAKRVLEEHK